jgi:hypothetical protein
MIKTFCRDFNKTAKKQQNKTNNKTKKKLKKKTLRFFLSLCTIHKFGRVCHSAVASPICE